MAGAAPPLPAMPSIRFASSKSFSVSPPGGVVRDRDGHLVPGELRSGWWPMSSAGSTSLLTNSTEPTKSASSNVLTIVVAVALPALELGEAGLDLAVGEQLHRRGPFRGPTPASGYPVDPCHSRGMRIASLVPSATEALFALGLGDHVVAVTHECDHPAEALGLPRLTRSVIPAGPRAAGDRRPRPRDHRAGRGPLRARRGGAGAARAGPDRHPGAVRGLRRVLRRRPGGGRRASTRVPT